MYYTHIRSERGTGPRVAHKQWTYFKNEYKEHQNILGSHRPRKSNNQFRRNIITRAHTPSIKQKNVRNGEVRTKPLLIIKLHSLYDVDDIRFNIIEDKIVSPLPNHRHTTALPN